MKPHFCEGHQGHPKTTMNNPDISALCFFLLLVQDPYFSAQKKLLNSCQGWCCAPRGSVAHSSPCCWACGMQRPGLFRGRFEIQRGFNGNPTWGKQPTKTIGKNTNLSQFYFSASDFFCVAIPLKDKRLCFMEDGSFNWWAIGIQSIIGTGSAWQCNSSTSWMPMF